jgi:hypothetical protein
VAHIQYIGKNGGSNGDLEAAKTEALQLANEITRAKLAKMRGDVLDRKMVVFGIESSWAILRERIMTLPMLVAGELRDLGYDRHTVRLRVESAIHRFLNEVADHLERVTSSPDFFAGLDDDAVAETNEQKIARDRKRDAANKKRRAKYARRNKST